MKGMVRHHQEVQPIQLGGGTERRILAYDESLMAVEVSFETGSEGAPHSHPHTQMSYVLSGSFRYSIEGESVILNPGDSVVVPGGLVHSTVCLEKGVLLDVFTPKRDDFLNT
jgi:quercetin dioxygenase-like cupin family protein